MRFSERGFSAKEFRLSMTRGDIGNYLGLTVETISRLLGRFQKSGLISVKGKYITVLDHVALGVMAGATRPLRLSFPLWCRIGLPRNLIRHTSPFSS